MGHNLGQILRVDRIEYVKEILPGRPLVLGELVREVLGERWVLFEIRPKVADRQLVILRHVDGVDVCSLEELLLIGEDLFHEVLGHLIVRRQVELD